MRILLETETQLHDEPNNCEYNLVHKWKTNITNRLWGGIYIYLFYLPTEKYNLHIESK
jgi:hypothetical protein